METNSTSPDIEVHKGEGFVVSVDILCVLVCVCVCQWHAHNSRSECGEGVGQSNIRLMKV